MINVVVKFLEAILTFVAAVLVIGCGIAGFAISHSNSISTPISFLFAGLGLIVGFIVSAIALGIPMLLLQINRHLESIRSLLTEQSGPALSGARLPESFYTLPTKATRTEK